MARFPNLLAKLVDPSQVAALWSVVSSLPGGGRIMGTLIGRMAPYSGTIHPEVLELQPGYARVLMRDTRRVRNHLNSVHAIALINLGEVTTGIAMLSAMAPNTRGIPVRLSMEYLKKARGPITGTCSCELLSSNEQREVEVTGELCDAQGEVVAKMHARWRLGPAS